MRDLAAHEKQEQQRLQKEHDHQKSVISELSRTKQKLSESVEEYEKQIAELTEQVCLVFVLKFPADGFREFRLDTPLNISSRSTPLSVPKRWSSN